MLNYAVYLQCLGGCILIANKKFVHKWIYTHTHTVTYADRDICLFPCTQRERDRGRHIHAQGKKRDRHKKRSSSTFIFYCQSRHINDRPETLGLKGQLFQMLCSLSVQPKHCSIIKRLDCFTSNRQPPYPYFQLISASMRKSHVPYHTILFFFLHLAHTNGLQLCKWLHVPLQIGLQNWWW